MITATIRESLACFRNDHVHFFRGLRTLWLIGLIVSSIIPSGCLLARAESQVTLEGLEVTQAIQEITDANPFSNTVPLIAGKKTVVRAYFDLDRPWWDLFSSDHFEITAKLTGSHSNGITRTLNPIKDPEYILVDLSENGQLQMKRHRLKKSLNFELPPELISEGTLTLSVANVEDSAEHPIGCSRNCGTNIGPLQFRPSAKLAVRLIKLKYLTQDGVVHLPSWRDVALIKYWLQRAYPIADENRLRISQQTVDMVDQEDFPATFQCTTTNEQIENLLRIAVYGVESLDQRTRFIGLVSDDYRPSGEAFVGCADTSAEVIDFTSAASVPTGPVIPPEWPSAGDPDNNTDNWDQDGSYGDWYTGHELAHLLGLNHLPFPAGLPVGPYDSYPYPNGQLSGPGSYVGFDTGGIVQGTIRRLKPMPGTEWHDVMTYSPKVWISDVTYKRIRCQLNNEDGINDTDCTAPVAQAPAALSYAKWDVGQAQVAMSRRVGITPFGRFPLVSDRPTPPGKKTQNPLPLITAGDFLNVIARINFVDPKKSKIRFVNRFDTGLITTDAPNSPIIIRFEGDDGRVLEVHPVVKHSTNTKQKKGTDAKPEEGLVNAMIRIPANFRLKNLRLLQDGQQVDSREIGRHAPDFGSSSRTHELRLVQGSERKKLSGQVPYHYTWSVEDQDNDKLSFTVLISVDKGTSWRTIAAGISRTNLIITEEQISDLQLSLPATLLIKVIASDGFNRAEQEVELMLSR